MAISKIDICNQALSIVGAQSVQALTDNTREAQVCNLWYDQCLRTVLGSHPWNFATYRVALARVDSSPREGAYAFRVPIKCLKILQCHEPGLDVAVPYQSVIGSDGPVIVASVPVLDAVYIREVDDTNTYSPGFIECLGLRLAVELAGTIKADKQGQGMLLQRYMEAMQRATVQDARQRFAHPCHDGGGYVEARKV